ncbi:MAG: hypothetical protein KIT27_05200 [Legionellales bacterium]|nr:hypothetical protein [Legionellales bacterium]
MNTRELFPLGKAYGDAFCNRSHEIEQLIGHLTNGKHTFIVAPRRYGKSSLCEQVFLKSQLHFTKIDFHLALTEKDIERFILNAVIRLIGEAIGSVDKLIATIKKLVKNLTPKLAFSSEHVRLELEVTNASSPAENIAESLLLLDRLLVEKNQRAALLLDEFQEIGAIKEAKGIEGAIRSAAQETKKLAMVFSGSNPHLLKRMFEDERRPLYKLCRKLVLPRISSEHYHVHLTNAAKQMWGNPLPSELVQEIINVCECHPYYMNYLCDVIWSSTEPPQTIESIHQAWQRVSEEESSDLIKDFLSLPENQKKVVKHIANQGGANLYSSEAAKLMDIPPGSIRGAIEQLIEKDFIQKHEHHFLLINPLYKMLLQEH